MVCMVTVYHSAPSGRCGCPAPVRLHLAVFGQSTPRAGSCTTGGEAATTFCAASSDCSTAACTFRRSWWMRQLGRLICGTSRCGASRRRQGDNRGAS
eukprot:364381-Chlamydomonas_euryale.AAC.3